MLLYAGLRGATWWTALTVVACVAVLLSNTIYFDGGALPRFLLEKGTWARNPWWLAAFYFHVVGASVCLAAGTPLMFPAFTRSRPAWHRCLGYVYLNAVLWMAAPSGLALPIRTATSRAMRATSWNRETLGIAFWFRVRTRTVFSRSRTVFARFTDRGTDGSRNLLRP
jgi:hypothetical protein